MPARLRALAASPHSASPALAARASAVFALALAACTAATAPAGRRYETWSSTGERPPRPVVSLAPEAELPAGARPWAGVVSHHLLAGDLIDGWFARLAARRGVRTFYVLSPSHWDLSAFEFSPTDGYWALGDGFVASDARAAFELAGRLGASMDPTAFDREHGVSTLMPYIARHFPGARVVALCYRGEPPVNVPMAQRLAAALAPAFGEAGRRKDFLLVSSDFAHHGDLAGTLAKDARTRRFFDGPGLSTWDLAGCDNRPGIYALAALGGAGLRSSVLYHSNSFELSGRDPDDITSYFFAYFY